jgi:hypothetical protein
METCEPFPLVKDDDEPLQEEYRGLTVSYPDFLDDRIGTSFNECLTHLTNIGDVLGGFVLQDNWPAANNTQNKKENMVYVPEVSSTPAGGNSFRES